MVVRIVILLLAIFFVQAVHAFSGVWETGFMTISDADNTLSKTASPAEYRRLLETWIGDDVHTASEKQGAIAALIAYLTDHSQAEQRGDGWQYRKNILLDYQNYVASGKEFPLRECGQRNDIISRAICIGKGTMIFHMLRNVTGDEIFFGALKELITEKTFSRTSWDDIEAVFMQSSELPLEWFFSQWLDRNDLPAFEVKDHRVSVIKGVRTITFEIVQRGGVYRFDLPATVRTDKGNVTLRLPVEKEKEQFEIPVDGKALEIVFDRDYDLMRKLIPDESPPLISALLGDEKRILVLPDEQNIVYHDLIEGLREAGFPSREEAEIKDADIRSNALFILGHDGRVVKRLFGHVTFAPNGFSLTARKNPINSSKIIAIAYADSEEHIPSLAAFDAVARFSRVRFVNGVNTEKATDEASRGIEVNLLKQVWTIQPGQLMRFEDALDAILNKTIIYAGERHTNYEDHKTQMEIIMHLHERGHTFAIGMEMFQRPFQKDIDDYLAGSISEREFLKKTQYFKRWKFDYNLYREIVEYAKAKRIPIVALNLSTEVVKKVSADGLDSLSDRERAELPASMDMSDEAYRKRLMEVFQQHRSHESKNFENFHQAQILWDETMAHTIDEFLRKNPGYQMVVLAGAGHLMYGSGIPQRAYRLNKKDYVIILTGGEFINTDMADYVASAEPLALPPTMKLGVVPKEGAGRVEIEKVVPGSIAKSAGLRAGDILLSLDDWKIEDIDDVHIFMSSKKRGEQLQITVLRKRLLFGYREVVLNGTI